MFSAVIQSDLFGSGRLSWWQLAAGFFFSFYKAAITASINNQSSAGVENCPTAWLTHTQTHTDTHDDGDEKWALLDQPAALCWPCNIKMATFIRSETAIKAHHLQFKRHAGVAIILPPPFLPTHISYNIPPPSCIPPGPSPAHGGLVNSNDLFWWRSILLLLLLCLLPAASITQSISTLDGIN